MATKKQCIEAAKRKANGLIEAELNVRAPAMKERKQIVQQLSALRARCAEIEATVKSRVERVVKLGQAARFCVDVQGGEPSMTELSEAVAAWENDVALIAELDEARVERKRLGSRMLWPRCTVWSIGNVFRTQIAGGDTWDEVLEKLENRRG